MYIFLPFLYFFAFIFPGALTTLLFYSLLHLLVGLHYKVSSFALQSVAFDPKLLLI